MSIYHYSDTSVVKEVVFRYAKDRPPIALLAAADNASSDQLSVIRTSLEAHGWQCVPAYVDGKGALQINGFKREAELESFLRQHNFVTGNTDVTAEPGDNPKLTKKEWVQRISLRIAGALNLVGDVGALINGIKRDEHGNRDPYWITGGGLYTVGGLVALGYGNTPKERFEREISEQTAEFLLQQTGGLEKGGALEQVLNHRKHGAIAKLNTYLYHHAADVMLGAYAAGAAPILAKGIMKGLHPEPGEKANWSDAYYGGFSLAVKATALLTPEKVKVRKAEESNDSGKSGKKTIWQRILNFLRHPIRWFTEQPLRIFGGGSLFSEFLLAYRSYRANKEGKKKGMFTWISAGSYALSDIFAMISKKNHVNAEGELDADEQRRIEATVAEEIAKKPDTEREELARKTGSFLAKRGELKGSAETIAQSILEQAAHMRNNPWADRVEVAAPAQPSR